MIDFTSTDYSERTRNFSLVPVRSIKIVFGLYWHFNRTGTFFIWFAFCSVFQVLTCCLHEGLARYTRRSDCGKAARNLERNEKKQQQQKSLLTEVNAKLKVNGEGNGNENLKKALGLVSKQQFLIHFFTVSA